MAGRHIALSRSYRVPRTAVERWALDGPALLPPRCGHPYRAGKRPPRTPPARARGGIARTTIALIWPAARGHDWTDRGRYRVPSRLPRALGRRARRDLLRRCLR